MTIRVPCAHKNARYKQINRSNDLRITVADLVGLPNPYHWRVEYCLDCKAVLATFGDVPPAELEGLRL